jgi:spore coat polysaccharide biosynthesis protein SpsF
MKVGVVLQARLGSRRLPGKALLDLGGTSILERCLRRLDASKAGAVILATTCRPEDDALERTAIAAGFAVFRGSETDVLGRFIRCAEKFALDVVVRATADNPGVDVQAPGRLLSAMSADGADYVWEDGLPYGAAVEVVTTAALTRAAQETAEPADREHVTPFVRRRSDLFRVMRLDAPSSLARRDVRLTVDTPQDLRRVRELYRRISVPMPSLTDLIAASDAAVEASVA